MGAGDKSRSANVTNEVVEVDGFDHFNVYFFQD